MFRKLDSRLFPHLIQYKPMRQSNITVPLLTLSAYLKPEPVDPRIKPLVKALNATDLVRIFSSSQGHFDRLDPTRQYAYVHFRKISYSRIQDLQFLLKYLVSETSANRLNAMVAAGRVHLPWETQPSYLITITPLCPTSAAASLKRTQTDEGIRAAAKIVLESMKPSSKVFFKAASRHFHGLGKEIQRSLRKNPTK